MIRLLHFELIKLFRRSRTYLSMGLMVVLVALIFWGLKSEGEKTIDYLLKLLNNNFIVNGNILNGYLVIYMILNTLWIHVPVLIVIVTGDLYSSELESGTIRLIGTRPIKRYKLVFVKHFTAIIFVFVFMAIWALISIWPAFYLFGKGDLAVVFSGLQILEESELFRRFIGAFLFAFLGMSSFAIFSVAISFFTRKSLTAILIAMGIMVISTLLQTLAPTLFTGWESFLLTYHLSQWQLFFYSDLDVAGIQQSVFWLTGFSAICVFASIIRFNVLKITE